jgi:hypothetical protein
MKTLLTVQLHSFVDLITNSSSELFTVDGVKSLGAFKAALVKLGEESDIREDELFTSVFRNILSCPATTAFAATLGITIIHCTWNAIKSGGTSRQSIAAQPRTPLQRLGLLNFMK